MKKVKFLATVSMILIALSVLISCSSDSSEKNESKRSSTTSKNNVNDQVTPSTLSQNEFTKQVQIVCNSVDPVVFDEILKVDPTKDKDFQVKFDNATAALASLNKGFSAIVPPSSKSKEWQEGLESLTELENQVSLVSSQYREYVALLEESKTNTDPARTIQILARLIELGREYTENLAAADKSFKTVLTVGASAGVSKCRALEIGQS